jgi:hypothetical protein
LQRSWLRHYAISRKVAGSNPHEVNFSFYLILPAALCPWGRLTLLTEMGTRNLPGGGRPARKADKLTVICEPIVSQPYGPSQSLTGIALPFYVYLLAQSV